MVISREQIQTAFREAQERRREARKALHDAFAREQSIAQEVEALRTLARVRGVALEDQEEGRQLDIADRAEAVKQAEAGHASQRTIAQLVVQHFILDPRPATPSEVADSIRKKWGRDLSVPSIVTTRRRHEHIFRVVDVPNKRGAFMLAKDAKEGKKEP